MSLVGPRPIVQKEVVKYGVYIDDFYLVLIPGITGVAKLVVAVILLMMNVLNGFLNTSIIGRFGLI